MSHKGGDTMKALIYEYNPRFKLWYLKREREVLELTDNAIKIKENWLIKKWYPLKAMGMRFEIIKN